MGFFKGLVEIFSPVRYKVENNTSYAVYKGPVFKQYFVFKEDARKEYSAWIAMNNYDTRWYVKEGDDWRLLGEFVWGRDKIDEQDRA